MRNLLICNPTDSYKLPHHWPHSPVSLRNPLYDFANRERKPPSLEQRQKNWTVDLRD